MSNNIYQVLNISETPTGAMLNMPEPESSSALPGLDEAGDKWLIESCGEDGLNVYYQLWVVYPRGSEYQLILPWLAQEVCSHCQGQGVVYRWSQDNAAYESLECPECRGEGSLNYDSDIRLLINDGLGGQRVIRKRQAGRFNARLGLRGDLIINISWVDELPSAEACGQTSRKSFATPAN